MICLTSYIWEEKKDLHFFQLNTNGIRLAREDGYARKLKKAGLNTVFLQFDGVTDQVYETLRGQAMMELKKKGGLKLFRSRTWYCSCAGHSAGSK